MRNRLMKSCVALATICLLAGSIGCYETLFRLAPLANAKVDRALCGDWSLKSTSGSEIIMAVRNLDDHSYAVSWRSADEKDAIYMIADSTELQGVRFIHARGLPDDGTISDTHMIIRADLDGDNITVRNLNDDFLKQKTVDSDDSLRKTIEANLENNDLYDDDSYAGTRVKKE